MEQPASPIIIQGSQMPGGQKIWPNKISTSLPKIVFILLSLVIVGELVWGAWYILKPSSTTIKQVSNQPKAVIGSTSASAKISLVTDQKSVKPGDNLNVDVLIYTSGRVTTGTDLVIKYDPNILSLTKDSFTNGTIYDEYLGQVVSSKGTFSISGLSRLSSKKNNDGKFGTLSFKVLATGNTKIAVDFKPGATADSNVIDAKLSKDILDKVDNLEVNIR